MIVLFSCSYLPSIITTNYLVRELINLKYKVLIVDSKKNFNRKPFIPLCDKINFYSYDAYHLLYPIIKKSNILLQVNPYEELVNKLENVSYLNTTNVNIDINLHNILLSNSFKGAISIRFNQIFETKIIEIIKKEGFFWNIHGGLLPKYRGLMGVSHALLNNETYVGWSIHEISKKIDEGNIINTIKIKRCKTMTILEYEILLSKLIIKKVLLAVQNINRIAYSINDISSGQTYSNLTKKEILNLENNSIIFSNNNSFSRIISNLSLTSRDNIEAIISKYMNDAIYINT